MHDRRDSQSDKVNHNCRAIDKLTVCFEMNDVRSIVQIQVNTIRTEADVHASLFNVSQTMLERLAVIAEAPARKQESSQYSVFLMSYHGASDRYLPLLGLQFNSSLTKLHHPEDSNPQTFKPHTVHESVISEDINSNATASVSER